MASETLAFPVNQTTSCIVKAITAISVLVSKDFIKSVARFVEKIRQGRQLWRYMGAEWLAYRLGYALVSRTGKFQRQLPVTTWEEQPLEKFLIEKKEPKDYLEYRLTRAPQFFFNPRAHPPVGAGGTDFLQWDKDTITPQQQCDDLEKGNFTYFSKTKAHLGFPPDWHLNPFTNFHAPTNLHWIQIKDFANGDIKIIWEPNHFSFVYALVRAFWRTGEERYAEMFWQLIEDWREQNPPQVGTNWKCGQETSFRVMAWCFGLCGFLYAKATTPERVTMLSQMIVVSAYRVESNLRYAISQKNNHGISEGLGLFTIGVLFSEFRKAKEWRETGKKVLEELGKELIYEDGSFTQHSTNYHRLMLHDYLWCLRLGELNGEAFSNELKERISTACDWLYQMQDEETGRAPNYGHNDGALILPLDNCDYTDFRPVIQAVHYLIHRERCYKSGAWDEDLFWLFGRDALGSKVNPPQRKDFKADVGGYYTLRNENGFAFIRCADFRHRPAQADNLHFDLWWRGQNIATDAGTYSYNAPQPWNNALGHTSFHNTVSVDGLAQMEMAGKFLWLPWVRGRMNPSDSKFNIQHSTEERIEDQRPKLNPQSAIRNPQSFECEHDGYQRLKSPVSYQRSVLRLEEECWIVFDRLRSRGKHDYRLHWLLMDAPYSWNSREGKLRLETLKGNFFVQMLSSVSEKKCSFVRADENSPRGWQSLYYNHRQPALSIDQIANAESLTFATVFCPTEFLSFMNEDMLEVKTKQWSCIIKLN